MMLAHLFAATLGVMPLSAARQSLDPFVAAVLDLKVEIDLDCAKDHPFGLCPSRKVPEEWWLAAARGAEEWQPLYERIDAIYAMPEAKRALLEGKSFTWQQETKLMTSRHVVNMLCIRSALAARRGDARLAVDSLAEALDYEQLLDDGTSVYLLIEAALFGIDVSTLDVIEGEPSFDGEIARNTLRPRLMRLCSRFDRSEDEIRSTLRSEYVGAGIRPEPGSIDMATVSVTRTCRAVLDRVATVRTVLRDE